MEGSHFKKEEKICITWPLLPLPTRGLSSPPLSPLPPLSPPLSPPSPPLSSLASSPPPPFLSFLRYARSFKEEPRRVECEKRANNDGTLLICNVIYFVKNNGI